MPQKAIENTQKIADRCNVTLEFGNYKIPKYEVPEAMIVPKHSLQSFARRALGRNT